MKVKIQEENSFKEFGEEIRITYEEVVEKKIEITECNDDSMSKLSTSNYKFRENTNHYEI